MKRRNRWRRTVLTGLMIVVLLLLAAHIYHRFRLSKEAELRRPIGQLVEVEGHSMSVYLGGEGEKTLVFLSGGGTCSPILDFKSLYTLLEDQYRVAVVERFGYGFSDIVDKSRDINSILEDTRAALACAGITGPYVLCPHSMSGLEALYWAGKYPEEISAIVGLDMAVPGYYDSMDINIPLMRVAGWAANFGITRFLPGVAESDAIQHGTLTGEEKDIYRAIFFSRTATVTMFNEMEAVKENAKKVEAMGPPRLPMLLFLSDGSGGTGFDTESWRQIPKKYLAQVSEGTYIELDCPHYVHDYEYETIAAAISEFLLEQ